MDSASIMYKWLISSKCIDTIESVWIEVLEAPFFNDANAFKADWIKKGGV